MDRGDSEVPSIARWNSEAYKPEDATEEMWNTDFLQACTKPGMFRFGVGLAFRRGSPGHEGYEI